MMSSQKPRPRPPEKCTCKQAAVRTLEETLAYPARWIGIQGLGWFHAMPRGRFA
jgi:hypothetical protein